MRSESQGVWALPIVQNSKYLENTSFRKLDLCPSSGDGRETPTLLGLLERANLNTVILSVIQPAAET
jgi:hypothetical protein